MAEAICSPMDMVARNGSLQRDWAQPMTRSKDTLRLNTPTDDSIQDNVPTRSSTGHTIPRGSGALHDVSYNVGVDMGTLGKISEDNEEHVTSRSPTESTKNRLSAFFSQKLISSGDSARGHRRADSENFLSPTNPPRADDDLGLRKIHSSIDFRHPENGEPQILGLCFDRFRLNHQLVVSLKVESVTHREFLPRGALKDLVTQKAVDQELSRVDYLPKRFKHRPWWPVTKVWIGSTEDHKRVQRAQNEWPQTASPQPGRLCFQQILAILLLMGRSKKIWDFVKEEVSDVDLPFVKVRNKGIFGLQRRDKPHSLVRCLKKQSDITEFAARQWCVLAPFFGEPDRDRISHHILAESQILPFVYWQNPHRQGGSGQVYKAEIHPDHHVFGKLEVYNNVVAVKQFSTYDRDVFQNELHVLRNLRKRRHFHLHRITLLASYEQANQLYLILPWAEVDLEQYWKSKWPTAPPEIASWIKQQCCGIVEAVSHIHRYKTFSGTTMLDTNRPTSVRKESGQSTASTGRTQRTLFGRHGDIKPANILWFPGPSSDTLFGILKVSDFGTARFSDNEQVAVEDKSSVPNSRAYQSPECVLPDGKISSQCDVWALGCVFLEFVCWYFGGRELLLTFERDRRHFYETASFFTTMKHDTPPLVCAELKPPVTEMIGKLKSDSMFNKDLTDVLTVVQNDMLVVLKESVGSGDSCSWHAGSGRGRRSSLANIARTGLAPLSRHCSVSSEITQDY